jgi:hypothetical protein
LAIADGTPARIALLIVFVAICITSWLSGGETRGKAGCAAQARPGQSPGA